MRSEPDSAVGRADLHPVSSAGPGSRRARARCSGATIDETQHEALELGVALIEHPGGGGLSEREIRQALRALLREHRPARFPGPVWLERHGPPRLAAGVRRTGGGVRWAAELGVPPPSPVSRRWTDALIEAELRRVCVGARRWPSRAEFRAAGATGVLKVVYKGRGSRLWAQRLGLSTTGLRPRRSGRRDANGARTGRSDGHGPAGAGEDS